jgi:hypothetical protein
LTGEIAWGRVLLNLVPTKLVNAKCPKLVIRAMDQRSGTGLEDLPASARLTGVAGAKTAVAGTRCLTTGGAVGQADVTAGLALAAAPD